VCERGGKEKKREKLLQVYSGTLHLKPQSCICRCLTSHRPVRHGNQVVPARRRVLRQSLARRNGSIHCVLLVAGITCTGYIQYRRWSRRAKKIVIFYFFLFFYFLNLICLKTTSAGGGEVRGSQLCAGIFLVSCFGCRAGLSLGVKVRIYFILFIWPSKSASALSFICSIYRAVPAGSFVCSLGCLHMYPAEDG